MDASAGELPEQPGVDGAEGEFASFRAAPGAGHMVEQPRELGAGEIRIEEQTGFPAEQRLQAAELQFSAQAGGAAVLPDDGAVERPAGATVPEQRGLALVGEADGGDLFPRQIGLGQGGEGGAAGGRPQVARVVFDPAGAGKVLGELLLRGGDGAPAPVEDERAGGGGALVEGKDEAGAHDGGADTVARFSRHGKPGRAWVAEIAIG